MDEMMVAAGTIYGDVLCERCKPGYERAESQHRMTTCDVRAPVTTTEPPASARADDATTILQRGEVDWEMILVTPLNTTGVVSPGFWPTINVYVGDKVRFTSAEENNPAFAISKASGPPSADEAFEPEVAVVGPTESGQLLDEYWYVVDSRS